MQEMRAEMAAMQAERGQDKAGPLVQSVNVETINSRSEEDEIADQGVDGWRVRGRGGSGSRGRGRGLGVGRGGGRHIEGRQIGEENFDEPGSQNFQPNGDEEQNPHINGREIVQMPDQAEGLHPFTVQVMRVAMPENKVLPTMEKYGGDTDPVKHLRYSVDAMAVYSSNEMVWCRVFSLSLKGEALDWFHSLQARTVDSFATLRQMFTRQYAFSRTPAITYTALIRMRQGKDEPLKMFMKRFNKAARQVHNADQRLIVGALTTTLRPRPFVDYLYAEEPQTMEELQNRLTSCIRVEEGRAQQRGGRRLKE